MSDTTLKANVRRERLWPHMLVACLLSLLVPGLSAVYLGLAPKHEKDAADRLLMPFVCIAVYLVAYWCLLELRLFPALLMILAFSGYGAIYAIRDFLRAKRDLDAVSINSHFMATTCVTVVALATSVVLITSPLTDIRVFRAQQTTPIVEEGEWMIGLARSRTDNALHRGQLVQANLKGRPELVRILAVPGDLFGQTANQLFINGGAVKVRNYQRSGHEIGRLSEQLAYPADAAHRAQVASNQGNYVLRDSLARMPADTVVLGQITFIVARDSDLVEESSAPLPIAYLELLREDEVIVLWAKFWSFYDQPGDRSSLGQTIIPAR